MENLSCLFSQFPLDVFLFWLLPMLLLWWLLSRFFKGKFGSHIDELKERINFLEGELDACRKKNKGNIDVNIGDFKTKISTLESQLDGYRKKESDWNSKLTILNNDLASFKNNNSKLVSLEADLSGYKTKEFELNSKIASLNADIEAWKLKANATNDLNAKILSLEADIEAWKLKANATNDLNAKILSLNADNEAWKLKANATNDLNAKILSLEADIEAWKLKANTTNDLNAKILSLEASLDECSKKSNEDQLAIANLRSELDTNLNIAKIIPSNVVEKTTIIKEDLKIVEGIGPKIEELCNDAGILNFAQLANTSIEKLREILDAAGSRFQMHDPTTWPAQAKLADEGKWEELKKWQDELNRGKA